MRKVLLLAVSILLTVRMLGEVPPGYYQTANGKVSDALKSALYTIVKGHKTYDYTSSSTDTWDILKETDRDPNNPDNVLLFYTNNSVNAAQEYNSAKGWSREHVWAKSRGDFGTNKGPGTDCHALRPADISMNSTRNNRYFAEGGNEVILKSISTSNYLGDVEYTFEPRDAIKGDVARMIFYMATRYEGENGEPDLELIEEIKDLYDKSPFHGRYSELLKWHVQDPVDSFEMNRNEVVYAYQGNRNPFIDKPEYVSMIWGNITALGKETVKDEFQITSSHKALFISGKQNTTDLKIYNLSGRLIYTNPSIHSNQFNLKLPSNSKVVIVIVNGTFVKKMSVNN